MARGSNFGGSAKRYRYENARGITDKMYRVVTEYFLNGHDKEKAMIAAGYAASTAHQQKQVFNHPAVKAEIKLRQERQAKKADLSQEWVIAQFMKLALAQETLSQYKIVMDDGSLTWDFTGASKEDLELVTGLSTETYMEGRGEFSRQVKKFKIDVTKPADVLAHLARIQGMFSDRIKIEGDEEVVAALQAGRNRIKRFDAPDTS